MNHATFEDELLDFAATILRGAGYSIGTVDLSQDSKEDELPPGPVVAPHHLRLLLAQNRFFVTAVGAAATLDEMAALEARASTELSRLITSSHLGAKQWDVYLVLLTRQDLPDEGEASTGLVGINYNTTFFRRIVRVGVRPELEDVTRALRPFLPLVASERPEVLEDALTLLEQELPANGVDEQVAGRAIAAFRETGSLSSV